MDRNNEVLPGENLPDAEALKAFAVEPLRRRRPTGAAKWAEEALERLRTQMDEE